MALSLNNRAALWDSDPFHEVRSMQRQMDSMFHNYLQRNPSGNNDTLNTLWSPRVDVVEKNNSLQINAELPGLDKGDINIELHENILTFSGEKKQEKKEDKDKCHFVERTYGKFSRSFTLPDGVDSSQIHASFENGVLKLSVPLPEKKSAKKRIDIKQSQ